MTKHLNAKKILLEYKALLRILYSKINLEKKEEVIQPLYCRAYHQATLHAWKNNNLETAYEMLQNLFKTTELTINKKKEHVLIYDFSCCLFEVGKMKERQGDLQEARNFFEKAIERANTCLAMRQSLQQQQLSVFSQGVVDQVQEKLDEIKTPLASMRPIQPTVRNP